MSVVRRTVLSSLSTILLLGALPAQQPIAAPVSARPGPPPEIAVTLTFAGGPLDDLIAQVRSQHQDANIVVGSLAAEVVVPRIELREAPLSEVLNAVVHVLPDDYKASAGYRPGHDGGNAVYIVEIEKRRGAVEPTEVHVFSLATVTQALPTDDKASPIVLPAKTVLSAIEAAAKVDGRPIELRYHEDSELLFVKGTASQTRLVQEVLASIQREQERRRRPAADAAGREAR